MGQKINPTGLRIGVIKDWESRWYADPKDFGDTLVEDHKLREFLLELLGSNFLNPGRFLHFLTNATKLLVVDEFPDAGIFSANRALGVLAQLQFAELHSQGIEEKQAAGQGLPLAQNKFNDLGGLDKTHQSGKDP